MDKHIMASESKESRSHIAPCVRGWTEPRCLHRHLDSPRTHRELRQNPGLSCLDEARMMTRGIHCLRPHIVVICISPTGFLSYLPVTNRPPTFCIWPTTLWIARRWQPIS